MLGRMTLRAAALLALAAFGVHGVRYLIVPDAHAAAGHGYLAAAPVLLALSIALAAGRTLALLGRGRVAGRGLSWAAATAAIVAIHGGQELLERLLAGGGPIDAGVALVLPLAAIAGLGVSVLLRRTDRLLARAVAATGRIPRVRPPAIILVLAPPQRRVPIAAGLARNLAGRAPPLFG
jgi:hypothetical protein